MFEAEGFGPALFTVGVEEFNMAEEADNEEIDGVIVHDLLDTTLASDE